MKGKKFAVINLTIATLGYQTSTNKWDLCTISRHFCSFILLCVRRLFGTRRISTGGNLLPFNECPFETSNDMTGNSTCAPPTITLLPVYAPCVPRCAV